ncbi:cytochrome P450 [Aspergillus bombycis]|uniref:Cytochrome P450 n=1 Tax=Aspergillus bombycis TaxID=109264 RepID=A0A1F7ZNP6_9EURO|nr:cytochrome P450 [Aspergillus bombycis]OGM41086.1 cytochrome P450 [Aspergillus bombycis]
MFLLCLQTLAVAYVAWSLVAMEINYRRACVMGIPLVRLCIDPQNLLWVLIEPHLWPWLDRLPIHWGDFGRYSRRGWYFADRGESHRRYGPIWALVTPKEIYINVADSEAIHDIFQRRTDFIRPVEQYAVLEVYGPCISTANSTDWPRHRKVLATPFNESIMSFVWDESTEQTLQMLGIWASPGLDKISSVAKDTRTLSLNVLAAIGFRKSYPFQSASDSCHQEQRSSVSYRDALQTVLDNAILLMIMPRRFLSFSFAPESWHRLAKAATDFKQHMVRMLDEEVQAFNEGKAGSGGLMTSFVRAMNRKQEDAMGKADDASPKGLTTDEIFGNIFVINFAGHDTTANTLSFALLLLAAYPKVQDWVAEELRLLADARGQYVDFFPKLNRCRAVMLETLRLYPPIPSLPKWTNDQPQPLKVGDKTIMIPPKVGVNPSLLTMHIDPQHWEDPLEWKPSRWVRTSKSDMATLIEDEQLITPVRCTYFPWSDGPQNCPGNKFSQVEFVAVLASLFRNHRISPVANAGETFEQTRERVLATTRDVDLQLLLRMKDAEQVHLKCRRV